MHISKLNWRDGVTFCLNGRLKSFIHPFKEFWVRDDYIRVVQSHAHSEQSCCKLQPGCSQPSQVLSRFRALMAWLRGICSTVVIHWTVCSLWCWLKMWSAGQWTNILTALWSAWACAYMPVSACMLYTMYILCVHVRVCVYCVSILFVYAYSVCRHCVLSRKQRLINMSTTGFLFVRKYMNVKSGSDVLINHPFIFFPRFPLLHFHI